MIIGELITALIIAVLLSLLLAAAFGWERPGRPGILPSLIFLFFIIFITTWAIGGWLEPFGPTVLEVYWLPFLFIGLVVALILAAAIPPRRPRSAREAVRQAETASEAQAALGAFFWILFVGLIVLLAVRYTA